MRLFSTIVGLSAVLGGAYAQAGGDDGGNDGNGRDTGRKSGSRPNRGDTVGPETDLYIANAAIAPDGFSRSAVLAGSSPTRLLFPAPAILADKGDGFRLNVIDQLTDTSMLVSTSIHWHGFFQKGSNWADGPVGVTQCPITPNHSFLYQFANKEQAGTFWYHSHYSTQYCDGLRGAIVVYDPRDPHQDLYDFDDESTIITLADWYHLTAPQAQKKIIPKFDSTLINGHGRYPGGPLTDLAVINVAPNKRYRFRLVSISCDPNFTFSIDGHQMTIIEVDANNVEPLAVDEIQIFAGQRYSFVLNANQPVGNYWIRAQPNVGTTGFDGGINSAILRYAGAPIADPTTASSASNPMLETNLHALTNPAAPGRPTPDGADLSLVLKIEFDIRELKFKVNGATSTPPIVPVLLQILSGARTAQELMPSGSVYVLPPNKVIEISMPGGSTGSPHPIHLHGHSFSVVRSAGSSVYNYENPVKRDVVSIGPSTSDNVTIRFRTDNAGPWIMHWQVSTFLQTLRPTHAHDLCPSSHIDWHLELALSIVLVEDVPTIAQSKPPPAWDELCPTFNALPVQNFMSS